MEFTDNEWRSFACLALKAVVIRRLGSEPKAGRGKLGPVPAIALRFEQIRLLPRKEQDFILRFLDIIIEKNGRA